MTRKRLVVIGVVLVFFCAACLVASYQALLALQVRNIVTLGWEGDHNLWTAGGLGTVRWDVNQQTIVDRTWRPDKIDQIFVSREGEIWGYGHGIWLFESEEWVEMGETAGLQSGPIYDMVQTNDGTIWVATEYGFKTWNKKTRLWESTLIDKPGRTLIQALDDSLWFGLAEDGTIRLQSGKLTQWTTTNGLVDNRVDSILAASDNTVWVGTHSGVSRWDGKTWQSWEDFGYPDPDGLSVFKLLETKDGAIWADTSQDFAKWEHGQWTTYERAPFCGNSYSFLETDDSGLWAGCTTGIFRWTGMNWREYDQSEGLTDNSFGHLIHGTNGILYASTKSGMYSYIPQQDYWQSFPE